jgi:glycosyltransferase involved in cell wall biosynthesis
MKIYYWSPFISHVATVKSVINSAASINSFSNKYTAYVVNVAGEWNTYEKKLLQYNIKLINLTPSKVIDNKNINGFFMSRFIYLYLFIISLFPLIKLLKLNPPKFLIIHLISSLPLILNYFFNFKTKMILRISGLPKLNFIRKIIWKFTLKKIHIITCPTKATKKDLEISNIVEKSKLHVLYDPIINPDEIYKKTLIKSKLKIKNYYLAVGRLTKQKNFLFLIDVFKDFNRNKNNILVIVGEGEQRKKILNFIKKNNLVDKVFIHNFSNEIFSYYKNCKCFVLSSLWEDPGFVLVEACYMNSPVISSDCKNGPKEILEYGKNGILFKSNDRNSLLSAFDKFENMSREEIYKLKVRAKIKSKNFTIYSHYRKIKYLFNNI